MDRSGNQAARFGEGCVPEKEWASHQTEREKVSRLGQARYPGLVERRHWAGLTGISAKELRTSVHLDCEVEGKGLRCPFFHSFLWTKDLLFLESGEGL